MPLSSKQRQFLKGLAHPLSPIVRVGRGGATAGVIAELKTSIGAHELVKVRVEAEDAAERKSIAETLATAVGAEIAGSVGKVVMLYRPADENPKIKLPK